MSEATASDRERDPSQTGRDLGCLRFRAFREVRAAELRPLLEQETAHWLRSLEWDFSDVASAVAEGVEGGRLDGCLAEHDHNPVGYCYLLEEGRRLVVGSVFVVAEWRGQGVEESLVDVILARAGCQRDIPRIEGQTLFCTSEGVVERLRGAGFVSTRRLYMVRRPQPTEVAARGAWRLTALGPADTARVAEIVYQSHVATPDATFNSTYASVRSCREFVESLVSRRGCGTFDPRASFVAHDEDGPQGMILCTRLGGRNGHVCQVSVVPRAQHRGLGRLLMTSALATHAEEGLAVSSLSVTEANAAALSLYGELDFRVCKAFETYAWTRDGQSEHRH